MSVKDSSSNISPDERDILVFSSHSQVTKSGSSRSMPDVRPAVKIDQIAVSPEVHRSPSFNTLARPELPALPRENRARLQMQSPTRIFFYWSTAADPFRILDRAITGPAGNYVLVLKLADLKRDQEEIIPIEAEGSAWFDVKADGEYRAEIGMYAASRPYIRIMFSNSVSTPRRSPSARLPESAQWRGSSEQFSKTLEAAGYEADAFDVLVAGDDPHEAADVAYTAFAELLGTTDDLSGILPEEIRYALLAVAAKMPLETVRWQVGPELFAVLQANVEKLDAGRASAILSDRFAVETPVSGENDTTVIYGSSLINFPRGLRRRHLQRPETISSNAVLSR